MRPEAGYSGGQDSEDAGLTPRQRQIAALIAQGLSNEQIAERLVIARGTVANHVAQILQKLGVETRVQVAVKITADRSNRQSGRVLQLLERLREVEAASASDALQHVSDVLAPTFAADKVDAFICEPNQEQLVALGTSRTPMGEREKALGLDRLPIRRGGRAAQVFRDGRPYLDGQVHQDPGELPGVRKELGVRSAMGVPLDIGHGTRGVLMVASGAPDYFTADDLSLLQFVAYWVGLVAREGGQGTPP